MMLASVREGERTTMPKDAEVCMRFSVVIVAATCWSGCLLRDTSGSVSAPSGLRDCLPRTQARPIRCAAPAV